MFKLFKKRKKNLQQEEVNKVEDLKIQAEESQDLIEKTADEEILGDKQLKVCFEKVLQIFNKNISHEALYSNTPIDDNDLKVTDVVSLSKKFDLRAELRRINILDVKTGPCIFLLKNNQYLLLVDENTIFNPASGQLEEFNPKETILEYVGYSLFFYEEELSVGSFIKKTSFLFKSVKNFRTIFIEIASMAFFINIFAAVAPIFTMNVYDRVIPNYALPTLFVLALGMLFVYIFDFIFKIIRSYLIDYISLNIGQEVDNVLMNRIFTIKAPGINMSNGAKAALFRELGMVREFYFSRFIPTLIDMPFILLFFGIILLISPILAIVPLVASIIVFIVNILMQVPLQNTHANMIQNEQYKNGVLIENISASESVKIYNATGKSLYRWNNILDQTYNSNFKYNLWLHGATHFSIFMMNIVTIATVVVGVFEISANIMTIGGLIAASTLSGRIMSTMIAFSGLVVRYRSIQNTLRHLEKVINSPLEEETKSYGKKGPFKGDIKFKDVTFFYPSLKQPILSKCSFHIKAKSKVAIIGKTGAGKSTITRLLLGLDFHNGGQILIDDIDINNIHINELRANIGFMPQKSFFFNGTIRENILMGNVMIPEEQYQEACEIAGVRLITELSARGDDMVINEGGSNLSGGQQQIVALARAIINKPNIIIMDEPTNGMDTSLETIFIERVKKYTEDKTFILITHKPSQLNLVDRVILVDKSMVVVDDEKEKVIAMLNKSK